MNTNSHIYHQPSCGASKMLLPKSRGWFSAVALVLVSCLMTQAAVFEEQTHPFPNLCYGSYSLGDYNHDGLLDVFMMGMANPGNPKPLTQLYQNQGNFVFTLVTNTTFIQATLGSSAWADLNGDGRPDLVYCGTTNGAGMTAVYLNRGNGVFELLPTVLPGNSGFAAVSLADYDRDGYPDILLADVSGSATYSVRLFRNLSGQAFVEVPANLGAGAFAAWGDYDNDGYPDILKASLQGSTMAQVLHNNRDGTFSNINAGLDPVADGSFGSWGDYDNDGYLDILLTGWDGSGNNRLARVYHNNGNGTFTRAFTGLTGADRIPTARWGDYDGDGFLDILITGFHLDQVGPVSRVFRNNGNGGFSDIGAGLQPLNEHVGIWGDLDGDGDLDVILGGTPQDDLNGAPSIYSTKLYRNTTAPSSGWKGLGSILHGSATLAWYTFGPNIHADLSAFGAGSAYPIAAGMKPIDSTIWDTTTVPDGIYDLKAVIKNASAQEVGSISKTVLIRNNAVWHTGTIMGKEVWAPGGIHIVEGNLMIATNGQVTIPPGAVVKFTPAASLTVKMGGTLIASGAEGARVSLTSLADDTLGGDDNMDGDRSKPQSGDWNGISADAGARFTSNDQTVFRYQRIVHSGVLAGDETWKSTFLHTVLADITVPAGKTLNIEPGAVVKIVEGQSIVVSDGGVLTATGTVAQPIIFTSIRDDSIGGDSNGDGDKTVPAAGDWKWIYLGGGSGVFNHCRLYYGGGPVADGWGPPGGPGKATIKTSGTASLLFSNSVLDNSFYDGILAWGGPAKITSSVFTGIDRAVCAHPGSVVEVVNATFDDNRVALLVHGGSLNVTNCIVVNSTSAGVLHDGGPNALSVSYTDIWNTNAALGNYSGTADQTGQNGNLSVNPEFKRRAHGNYQLNFASPCIDAANGFVAPLNDNTGAPRYDDPRSTNRGLAMPAGTFADMGAFEFVEAAPSDVDLVATSITGPSTAMPGDKVAVEWTVANVGTGEAIGPWHNAICLVLDPQTKPAIIAVADILTGQGLRLGPGQSATFSTNLVVPASVVGDYFWQVAVNSRGEVFEGQNTGNNQTYSIASIRLDCPELTVNGPSVAGQLLTEGQSCYYKLRPVANEPVTVTADQVGAPGSVEIYLARGYLPSQSAFDARSNPADSAVSASISTPIDDIYYVLAYHRSASAQPVKFALAAKTASFQVQGATPAKVGNQGAVTLTIFGVAFPSNSSPTLITSLGTAIQARTTYQARGDRIQATFDLTSAEAGAADVVVRSPGGVLARLDKAVEITSGGASDFWIEVVGPENLRAGRPTAFEIRWGNRGNMDAPVHLIDLPVPPQVDIILVADGAPVGDRLEFFTVVADCPELVVPPGTSQSHTIYIKPKQLGVFTLDLGAVRITDPLLAASKIDWTALESIIRTSMSNAEWGAFWPQYLTQIGGSWASLLNKLAHNALALNQSSAGHSAEDALAYRTVLPATLWEMDQAMRTLGWNRPSTNGTVGLTGLMHSATTKPNRIRSLTVSIEDYARGGDRDLNNAKSTLDAVDTYLMLKAQQPLWRNDSVLDKTGATDDDLTEKGLLNRVKKLADDAQQGETIFFYYAGHGGPLSLALPQGQHLYWRDLYHALASTKAAKIVVVIEACHSGAFADFLKHPPTAGIKIPVDPSKWAVVTSSGANESSYDPVFGYDKAAMFTRQFFRTLQKGGSMNQAWQQNQSLWSLATVNWYPSQSQSPQWFGSDTGFVLEDEDGKMKDNQWSKEGLGKSSPSGTQRNGYTHKTVGSFDPNDKSTIGYGPTHYVGLDQTIQYTIYFENDPAHGATAPVQELLITDSLSSLLDWQSFELGTLAFGETQVAVAPGQSEFTYLATVPGDPYPVMITAGLDRQSGLVTWRLSSVDPVTQDLPEDPLAGFLPVNDASHQGEGYVTFTIRAMTNATLVLTNRAVIVFDPTYGANAPINTPIVTNVIDSLAPSSQVASLAAVSPATFALSWSGSDNPGGSGIASYDIYVSTSGSLFVPWLKAITTHSAMFSGQAGSAYRFFSIARDNVGNVESLSSPDAFTRVEDQTPAPATSMQPGPDMNTARMGHYITELPDGRVVVLGGRGNGFVSLNSIEIWHPETNLFGLVSAPYTFDFGALVRLTDGRYLMAGGAANLGVAPGYNTAQIFDPANNTVISTGTTMTKRRTMCRGALLANGKVLIVGGWYDNNSATYGEIYDPANRTYTVTGSLRTPRALPIVLPTTDGKAVIAGGMGVFGSPSFLESVELYDPGQNVFTALAATVFAGEAGWALRTDLDRPIDDFQTADGRYVFLASRTTNSLTEVVLALFDPATRQFTKRAMQPAFTEKLSVWPTIVASDDNAAYFLSGYNTNNAANLFFRVQRVDLTTGERITSDELSLTNYYPAGNAATLLKDGRLFVTGGTTRVDSQYNFNPVKHTFMVSGLPGNAAQPTSAGLEIRHVPPGSIQISWPSSMVQYVLQSVSGLNTSPNWRTVTNRPSVVGDRFALTLSAVEATRYYRLYSLPRLSLQQTNGMLRLSWPKAAADFRLEMAVDLLPATQWHPVSDTPLTGNDRIDLIIEPANPGRYYRLVWP